MTNQENPQTEEQREQGFATIFVEDNARLIGKPVEVLRPMTDSEIKDLADYVADTTSLLLGC